MMFRSLFVVLLLIVSYSAVSAQTDCPAPIISENPIRFASIEEGDLLVWDIYPDPTEAHPLKLVDSDDVSRVSLSPDGEVVVFTRQLSESQHELWAINADGSDERLLVSAEQFAPMRSEEPTPDGFGVYRMEWIPGTHTLAFNTRVYYDDGIYIPTADDLWTVDVDSGELNNLLPRGEGGDFLYSPDGAQIAIMTLDSLSIINADGTQRRDDVLEEFQAVGFGEYYQFPRVSWAADNRTLMVVTNGGDAYSQSEGVANVWAVDTNSLATEPRTSVRAFYPAARLSADGTKLAYWVAAEEGSNTRTLTIVDIFTLETVFERTATLLEFFAWSPDSAHFIYRDEDQQLRLANFCGMNELLVEDDTFSGGVLWVDSGRYIMGLNETETYLNTTTGSSTLLSSIVTGFDFVVLGETVD